VRIFYSCPKYFLYSCSSTRHIGAFGDTRAAVLKQHIGVMLVKFILRRTGEGYITGELPWFLSRVIFSGITMGILFQIPVKRIDIVQFFDRKAVFIIDCSATIGNGDDFSAQ